MTNISNSSPRFAVCINNIDYPASLERHKIYQMVPDETSEADGDIRIIDESGEDYLYPANYFIIIDVPQVLKQSLLAQK